MAPWPLLLAAITSTTSAWAAQIAVAPKHILVTGGIMKSHQLSLVPIIEALLERGHQVTFVLPNSSEAHGWFPEGIGRARLLHLGPEDGGIESIKIPDMKNLAAHQKIAAFLEYLWNYRQMVDKPLFGVTDDLKKLLEQSSFDVAFASSITLGCTQVLSRSGLPWIGFMSISAQPEFVIQDTDLLCNYPNMVNPRSLNELKESLWMRVQNRIECKLLHAYTYFVAWMLNGMLRDRGFRKAPNVIDLLMAAPINVMLGGPPLQLPMQLPAKVQVVGVVERATPRPLPSELAAWLGDHEKTVLYISMGTKYELSREICQKLVEILRRLQNDSLRILWSLRPQQQELLQDLLPSPSSTMRIEAFTPQPEVLAHPSVKVFLSHCGWGGVTDTLAAGVPTLAYPSFSDQRGNAQRLVDLGAALLVQPDFQNLEEATRQLLQESSFALRARRAGEALRTLGGADRVVELLEAAAEGRYLEAPPEVQRAVNQVDPFLHRTHEVEMVLSTAFACFCFLLSLCIFTCCCRCCLWCCCSWTSKPKRKVSGRKKQQ